MTRKQKIQTWIQENAPMLVQVYDNKYVGMVYDRFASLSVKRQKQWILGVFLTGLFVVFGYLLSSYWGVWSNSRRVSQYAEMTQLLQEYQKQQLDQSSEIQNLEKNSRLTNSGAFKELVMQQAATAGISPRMVQVQEQQGGSGEGEVSTRQAQVKLEKVNLRQLKAFLQSIEQGDSTLSVPKLRVVNDDKIRGYLNVEMTVSAYVFQAGEESL